MNVNVRVSDCDYGAVLSLSPFHLFLCIFLSFPFLYSLSVFLQQFPYPPYRRDLFLLIVDFILPLFVILSFIYSAGVFVKVQYITAYVGGPPGYFCVGGHSGQLVDLIFKQTEQKSLVIVINDLQLLSLHEATLC